MKKEETWKCAKCGKEISDREYVDNWEFCEECFNNMGIEKGIFKKAKEIENK